MARDEEREKNTNRGETEGSNEEVAQGSNENTPRSEREDREEE